MLHACGFHLRRKTEQEADGDMGNLGRGGKAGGGGCAKVIPGRGASDEA